MHKSWSFQVYDITHIVTVVTPFNNAAPCNAIPMRAERTECKGQSQEVTELLIADFLNYCCLNLRETEMKEGI